MEKQITDEIKKRLDGFPEDKIASLIDYIEFLKRDETLQKESNTPKGFFLEAGP